MKFKNILEISLASISMFSVGYILGIKHKSNNIKHCGNIRLDNSDKDEPMRMFLEVTDINSLMSAEYVNLKVIKEWYISR